jgi:hypothetical protein
VHGGVAEHYGVSPEDEKPYPSTLDYLVAVAGGWLLGTFAGALAARQVSFDRESLYADTVGEIETENKVAGGQEDQDELSRPQMLPSCGLALGWPKERLS